MKESTCDRVIGWLIAQWGWLDVSDNEREESGWRGIVRERREKGLGPGCSGSNNPLRLPVAYEIILTSFRSNFTRVSITVSLLSLRQKRRRYKNSVTSVWKFFFVYKLTKKYREVYLFSCALYCTAEDLLNSPDFVFLAIFFECKSCGNFEVNGKVLDDSFLFEFLTEINGQLLPCVYQKGRQCGEIIIEIARNVQRLIISGLSTK